MKKHFYSCCQLALLVTVIGCLGACKNNSNSSSSGGGNDEEGNETLPYDNGNRFLYPNTQIQRFDYNGVKISNDSPFRQEFNYALDFLLTIPTDDYLKNMRVREGMDVPGSTYLGGWYSDPNIWIAATFGQYVSSLARGYAITGDLRYKQKATELIDGWADTITKDGPNKGYFYFNMKYEVGQLVIGTVTNVKPYALFMDFEDGVSGLLHISEISDSFIRDIEKYGTKGDQLKVMIVSIDENNGFLRVSLKKVPKEDAYSTHNNNVRKAPEANDEDFAPLAEKLPEWIKTTLEEAEKDKEND